MWGTLHTRVVYCKESKLRRFIVKPLSPICLCFKPTSKWVSSLITHSLVFFLPVLIWRHAIQPAHWHSWRQEAKQEEKEVQGDGQLLWTVWGWVWWFISWCLVMSSWYLTESHSSCICDCGDSDTLDFADMVCRVYSLDTIPFVPCLLLCTEPCTVCCTWNWISIFCNEGRNLKRKHVHSH